MSCTDLRPLLPEAVYGDLAADDAARVTAHLASCPACREELAVLRRVKQQLATLPAPAVHVDLSRLYQEAARRQNRRWRRWVAAGAGVAAAILVGLLVLKLEVRADAQQLVVRWGTVPETVIVPPVAPAPAAPSSAAMAAATPEQLQLLSNVLDALTRDAEDRDAKFARLEADVRWIKRQSDLRLAAFERDVDALYTVQFHANEKGADR